MQFWLDFSKPQKTSIISAVDVSYFPAPNDDDDKYTLQSGLNVHLLPTPSQLNNSLIGNKPAET